MAFFPWRRQVPAKSADELLAEAKSLAAEQRYAEVVRNLSRVKTRHQTPQILVELAKASLQTGDKEMAASSAFRALQLDPGYVPAICVQGELLFREKRTYDALSRFREARELDPGSVEARAWVEKIAGGSEDITRQERQRVHDKKVVDRQFNPNPYDERRLTEIGNNATELYQQGRFDEAMPIAQEAVEFARSRLGETHAGYATSLNNLAALYHAKQDYASAERMSRLAVDVLRAAVGEQHPDYAVGLDNLAALYKSKGDLASAEPLHRRAAEVLRVALGEEHPAYAASLHNLAALCHAKGT